MGKPFKRLHRSNRGARLCFRRPSVESIFIAYIGIKWIFCRGTRYPRFSTVFNSTDEATGSIQSLNFRLIHTYWVCRQCESKIKCEQLQFQGSTTEQHVQFYCHNTWTRFVTLFNKYFIAIADLYPFACARCREISHHTKCCAIDSFMGAFLY